MHRSVGTRCIHHAPHQINLHRLKPNYTWVCRHCSPEPLNKYLLMTGDFLLQSLEMKWGTLRTKRCVFEFRWWRSFWAKRRKEPKVFFSSPQGENLRGFSEMKTNSLKRNFYVQKQAGKEIVVVCPVLIRSDQIRSDQTTSGKIRSSVRVQRVISYYCNIIDNACSAHDIKMWI